MRIKELKKEWRLEAYKTLRKLNPTLYKWVPNFVLSYVPINTILSSYKIDAKKRQTWVYRVKYNFSKKQIEDMEHFFKVIDMGAYLAFQYDCPVCGQPHVITNEKHFICHEKSALNKI